VDDYNYEGEDVVRFARISPWKAFTARVGSYTDTRFGDEVVKFIRQEFIRQNKPRFLLCSPDGPIGRALSVGNHADIELPSVVVHLHRVWQGEHWEIFELSDAR